MAVWLETIDLKDAPKVVGDAFEEFRDAAVKAIRESPWFKDYDDDSRLHWYVRELEAAQVKEDFVLYMHGIYNVADEDRVWIETA